MRSCAAAKARGAGPREQCSPLWPPIDDSQAVGADLGTERAWIDPPLQHASGVDAGQTVHSWIEGV